MSLLSCFSSIFVTFVFVLFVLLNKAFSDFKILYLIYSSQIIIICFATDWVNKAFENYGFVLVKSFFLPVIIRDFCFIFVKKTKEIQHTFRTGCREFNVPLEELKKNL